MVFRAIALSLALLVGMGSLIPFINDSTEAKPGYTKKKYKKLKKYSKAWWRWYRKQKRIKRAILARKRALRAKQILLARQRANRVNQPNLVGKTDKKLENFTPNTPIKKVEPSPTEQKVPVSYNNGKNVGTVLLSVVGQATIGHSDSGHNKIGGIPTSSLRQNVVAKMVKEEGWVVNDYHKTVNGKKVYVVVAQSPLKGIIHTRLFYFTEIDGKIYSLSSTSLKEEQENIAQESEKMIQSLQRGNNLVGLK